jgi:hypothetical protein
MIKILFVSMLFVSCAGTRTSVNAINSPYGNISFSLPNNWKQVEKQGIDSYIGLILTDTGDTLHYNLGYFSYNLDEREPDDFEGDYTPFEKTRQETINVSGYKIKLVIPKKKGIGMTGIYLDSVSTDEADIVKFNLYGINLNKRTEKKFYKMIKTLKFIGK